jgi:hypothetical protein
MDLVYCMGFMLAHGEEFGDWILGRFCIRAVATRDALFGEGKQRRMGSSQILHCV